MISKNDILVVYCGTNREALIYSKIDFSLISELKHYYWATDIEVLDLIPGK